MLRVYGVQVPVDARTPAQWLALLPLPRRNRVAGLRFPGDRVRALAADRLLRYALRDTWNRPVPLDSWRENRCGKPELAGEPGIHFNLSHSGAVVLCAVADAPVGVDVERERSLPEGVARRVLSPEELAQYRREGPAFLIQAWAMKESCGKCAGRGLDNAQLGRPPAPPPGCAVAPLPMPPGYRGAVCAGERAPAVIWVNWADL